ncbi:MAG: hypothetical protein M3Z85_05715 [Acidobacteriota bacterium]|nr:hypothetical protein [Acidobacteriota bacterium]
MSCSPSDLNDFFWNELAETDRREVERHVKSCRACGTELDRLKTTQAALKTLPDEEIPRRIGFLSDRVFEPSRARRWWAEFWASAAKLGFASAAMLSAALVVFAVHEPPAVTLTKVVTTHEAAAPVDISRQVHDAIVQAVAETQARDSKKTEALLAAAERRHDIEHKNLMLVVQEDLKLMQKRLNYMTVASNDLGSRQ